VSSKTRQLHLAHDRFRHPAGHRAGDRLGDVGAVRYQETGERPALKAIVVAVVLVSENGAEGLIWPVNRPGGRRNSRDAPVL
jgi:hypothetical protein